MYKDFPDSDIRTPYKPPDNALSITEEWIIKDGKYLLWLPKDYRTTSVAIHGNTLVLGLKSGRVIFLRFNF